MSDKFSKLDPPEPPFFMKLILSVVLFVLCGVAIMLMWNWFVVVLGLPSIGLAHAMGIDLLVSLLLQQESQWMLTRFYFVGLSVCFMPFVRF